MKKVLNILSAVTLTSVGTSGVIAYNDNVIDKKSKNNEEKKTDEKAKNGEQRVEKNLMIFL